MRKAICRDFLSHLGRRAAGGLPAPLSAFILVSALGVSPAHAQADCELCGTWVRCEDVLCEELEDDGVIFEEGSRLTWVRISAGGSCELVGAYDHWEASGGQLTLSGTVGSETHEYKFHGDLLAFNGELWRQDAEGTLHATCQAAGSGCSDDAECLSGSCEEDRCIHGPGEEDEPDLPGFDEPGEDEPADPESEQEPPEADGDSARPPEFGDEPSKDDGPFAVGGPGVEGGSPRVDDSEQGAAADGGTRRDNEGSRHNGLEANGVEPGGEGCACSVVGRASSPRFVYSGALALLGLAWVGRRFRRAGLGVPSGSSRNQEHEGKGN